MFLVFAGEEYYPVPAGMTFRELLKASMPPVLLLRQTRTATTVGTTL